MINTANSILYVYGTEPAGIQDVYGRSLVIRELEYAAQRQKPASAILIGEDDAALHSEAIRLRKHLRRQLKSKICLIPEVQDNNGAYIEFSKIALETIWSHRTNQPLPEGLTKKLPDAITKGLADKNTASTTIASLCANYSHIKLPDYREVENILSQVEKLAEEWENHIGPVVSDQIFISYSREDLAIAERVQSALSEAGYTVWRDEARIKGGEQITSSLLDGINNSGAVLVLSSYAASKSPWVEKEVNFALQIQHDAGWQNFVIPLSLNETPNEIIPKLKGMNHLPLRSGEHFDNDIKILLEQLDKPRLWHRDHDR